MWERIWYETHRSWGPKGPVCWGLDENLGHVVVKVPGRRSPTSGTDLTRGDPDSSPDVLSLPPGVVTYVLSRPLPLPSPTGVRLLVANESDTVV